MTADATMLGNSPKMQREASAATREEANLPHRVRMEGVEILPPLLMGVVAGGSAPPFSRTWGKVFGLMGSSSQGRHPARRLIRLRRAADPALDRPLRRDMEGVRVLSLVQVERDGRTIVELQPAQLVRARLVAELEERAVGEHHIWKESGGLWGGGRMAEG